MSAKLAEGIKHVYGTLYEIPHDIIIIPKKGEEGANIRYLSGDDNSLGVGFEKPAMDRLYESIKSSGLHNPLICRWITEGDEKTVKLVDGERRWRNVERLLVKDEKVYDPATKKMVPASELYGKLLVRVYDAADDKEAIRLSYQENHSRVAFNDKVDISLVKQLRDKGFKDEEILDITGQKSDWLRDTDKLIAALEQDPDTLDALSHGVIRRDAALIFIGIEGKEERKDAIKIATDYADKQYKAKMEKLDKSIRRARLQKDEAATAEAIAGAKGDDTAKSAAKDKKDAAAQRIDDKTREKTETKPEVGKRGAKKAAKKKSGGARPNDGPRAMSNKKITKEFIEPYDKLIKARGVPEGETDMACHPDVLKAFRDVAKAIATSDEGQALRVAKKWYKHFVLYGFKGSK
jgi:ParB-like chromosome segregation protein Spo0J